jgi:hypothetical protein
MSIWLKMDSAIKPVEFERKSRSLIGCKFHDWYWNDAEQRNYTIEVCNHPENRGKESGIELPLDMGHNSHEYSCWHKNPTMPNRCWGESEKTARCPMAITKTEPEVECHVFVKEEAHPAKALVTKEEIKERFYQPTGACLTCRNCI